MNTNPKKLPSIFAVIAVISSFLLGAASVGMMSPFHEATAQNATTATNQTATSAANQTGAAGAAQNQSGLPANLTNSDFDIIRENLELVREGLQGNDNSLAYRALGWADNEIYILASEQGNQIKALLAQLRPLQDTIQKAQESILQGDNSTALNDLGSAEVALLQVTQKLPADETEEGEDVEDTDETEAEGG
jgi:hypothetical protein